MPGLKTSKMWRSRNKTDLVIEVWEYLDCENVGASEIVAIENVIREEFGPGALAGAPAGAVAGPMAIARLLADEGADLRHAEIMELYADRMQHEPYDEFFRNIIKIEGFAQAVSTIRNLENLRQKFQRESDREGLRLTRKRGVEAKKQAQENAEDAALPDRRRLESHEIAQWIHVWLETPDIFENWLALRQASAEFKRIFAS
jgi:hypothetical protein